MDEVKSILKYKNVVVVGLSKDPSRPSYQVAKYLKENGFRIIPVNPQVDEVLNEKCYPSLLELPENLKKSLEVVDIFQRSNDVLPIVEQAVEMKHKYGKPLAIWMQLGIINEEAAGKAKEAGLKVVMNKCMKQEYERTR